MSLKLLLSGANGYMGKVISSLVDSDDEVKIIAGFDKFTKQYSDFMIYDDLSDKNIDADVIIDFSHPSAFNDILEYALTSKTPIIFATTGLSKEQINEIENASKTIPVFFSANMSLGVNLMIDLVKKMVSTTEGSFDIEIIEKHHNRKVDAPSGTALKIADEINESLSEKFEYSYDRSQRNIPRPKKEIGISCVRGGTIVGEHSVIFAGHDEIIEIKHTAMSREIFAAGSINAAKFLKGKNPGYYSMNDLIKGD